MITRFFLSILETLLFKGAIDSFRKNLPLFLKKVDELLKDEDEIVHDKALKSRKERVNNLFDHGIKTKDAARALRSISRDYSKERDLLTKEYSRVTFSVDLRYDDTGYHRLKSNKFSKIAFTYCKFEQLSLKKADFTECNFSFVTFNECDLSRADFRGSSAHSLKFVNCILLGTKMPEDFKHVNEIKE